MAVLCFDYDGTLSDSLAIEEKYYLRAFQNHGVDHFRCIMDLQKACRDNYYEYCKKIGLSMELLDSVLTEYENILKDERIEIPLFDGVIPLLKDAISKHDVYIVSSNNSEEIRIRMEKEGISGFKGIIGWKEEPNKQKAISDIMKRRPGETCYFIGDTPGDMKEAAAAGVPHRIAVSYGWGLMADLENSSAQVIVSSVEELRELLSKA